MTLANSTVVYRSRASATTTEMVLPRSLARALTRRWRCRGMAIGVRIRPGKAVSGCPFNGGLPRFRGAAGFRLGIPIIIGLHAFKSKSEMLRKDVNWIKRDREVMDT